MCPDAENSASGHLGIQRNSHLQSEIPRSRTRIQRSARQSCATPSRVGATKPRPSAKSFSENMRRARPSGRIWRRFTPAWGTRIKLLSGWKRISKLAAGYCPGSDGHQPSRRSAPTRAMPTSSGAWDRNHEERQLLCRTEEAQCFPSCGRRSALQRGRK